MDIMDIARFWSSVQVGGPSQCWPWKKRTVPFGHGEVKIDGKAMMAHRVAYELAFGGVPDGMLVRHSCDTPSCCNPKHLLTGTHYDNARDRVIRQRGAIGENAGRAKLTDEKVLAIRASSESREVLAARHGVSIHNITAIRQRKTWKHLPG